jgi:ribosomal protein L21
MALKAKVANKVQTNSTGLIEGIITKVLEIDEKTEIEKGKEVVYAAQFEFQIEVEGSQKSITYRIWTRQTFNNEKYKKDDGTQDYNTFTRLMLQLDLITESDLKNLESSKFADIDVESVEGLKVQFELEDSRKNKGLKVPKVSSIKPLKLK